jgi:DNA-directed RNA polymerase sigma subunit (sigma70/sigma32)
MPFESRPIDPRAYPALERAVKATAELRSGEARHAQLIQDRAEAIGEARGHGLTLDAIATRLGVSRERVRQMASPNAKNPRP